MEGGSAKRTPLDELTEVADQAWYGPSFCSGEKGKAAGKAAKMGAGALCKRSLLRCERLFVVILTILH